jgi:phosphate/sulfate permease
VSRSAVGAIIGFTVVAAGWAAVQWDEVVLIVISWFLSPLISGTIAALGYYLLRRFILRSPNSLERGFLFYPVLISVTFAVNVFFVLYKGLPGIDLEDTIPYWQVRVGPPPPSLVCTDTHAGTERWGLHAGRVDCDWHCCGGGAAAAVHCGAVHPPPHQRDGRGRHPATLGQRRRARTEWLQLEPARPGPGPAPGGVSVRPDQARRVPGGR